MFRAAAIWLAGYQQGVEPTPGLVLADAAGVGRGFARHDRAQPDRLQQAQPFRPFGIVDGRPVDRRRALGPLERVVIRASLHDRDQRRFAVVPSETATNAAGIENLSSWLKIGEITRNGAAVSACETAGPRVISAARKIAAFVI
jgi:hypothetical protein